MSGKTKKYRWLPWAIVAAMVLGIGALGSNYANWYILEPWNSAKTVVTLLSIDAFSAGVDYSTFVQDATAPYWNLRLSAFAAILLTFVVGPSLWVYAEIKNQDRESEDVLKKSVAWYVGVMLVVASLQVVSTTVIKGVVFQNTWKSTAENKAKDVLRSDLLRLGYDALERYHLPHRYGGGAGSFEVAQANGEASSLQLSDLESYSQIERNAYAIVPTKSDSVIRIRGTSDYLKTDIDVAVPDAAVQIDLVVIPPSKFEFAVL